ncbi:hypothetical protein B0H11DRAFT_1933201 [Mycena galericulata]|nr:hypothetical protein B0H11DRAFT_1933201 [Mycena galericulata]
MFYQLKFLSLTVPKTSLLMGKFTLAASGRVSIPLQRVAEDVRLPGFPSDGTLNISETRGEQSSISIQVFHGQPTSHKSSKGAPERPVRDLRVRSGPSRSPQHSWPAEFAAAHSIRFMERSTATSFVQLELTERAIMASQRTGWAVAYATSSFLTPGTVAQISV